MNKTLNLNELLEINNTHYTGVGHTVNINGKIYDFIKGQLCTEPRKYYHPKYHVDNDNASTYVIQEINTGKVYVGSSKNAYIRIVGHKTSILKNWHYNVNLCNLLKETNIKNFELIIIFSNSRDEAYNLEQLLIDQYNGTGRLLNVASDVKASMLGKKHTDESKQMMSTFHKTDIKAIAQFSAIHDSNKRRVSVYGIEYDSITQAGEQSSYSESYIRRALSNSENKDIFHLSDNVSPLAGRTISDEQKKNLSIFRKTDTKAIAQFAAAQELNKKKIILNGTLYNSVTDAVDKTGISEPTIHRKLNLIGKCSDGPYVLNYTQPLTRKVSINGKIYDSTSIAASALGVGRYDIKNWIKSKSNNFKDYNYV